MYSFIFVKQIKRKSFILSLPVYRWLSMDYLDGKTKITLSTNGRKLMPNQSLSLLVVFSVLKCL